MPLISTAEIIEFSDFKIKPLSKDESYSDLLTKDIFGTNGSLIEINGFCSGDYYSEEGDIKTFNAIEAVKFGYFFKNPPHVCNISGYVSSENFECFRIIEKNEDPSFEQKIHLSNGMFNFSESLETYYKSRLSLRPRPVAVSSGRFAYVDYMSEGIENEQLLTAMRLYNRCWSTYSIHNSIDKPVLARVSIEILAKIKYGEKEGLKYFIGKFFAESFEKLEKLSKSSSTIKELTDFISSKREPLEKALTKHLYDIKEARHSFAHDGIETKELANIPFYLVWFPVFWMMALHSNKITEEEGIRLSLFFCLLNFEPKDWQKMDCSVSTFKPRKSHLHNYADNAIRLPICLKKEKDLDAVMKGIRDWLTPLCQDS